MARCALLLGECSWRERLVRPAVELVERALETSKSAGLPGVEWQAHAALARMGRESGDGAGAEHHARLARALVDTLAGGIDDPAIAVGFRAAAASG